MSIRPEDVIFAAGGFCLEKYGAPFRRVSPIERGGEDTPITHTRAGTAKFRGRDGVLRTAATNCLRVQYYDVTTAGEWNVPAVLLEGARANHLLQSQTLETSWTLMSLSLSTNVAAAPDGTTTADRLTAATATAAYGIYQSNIAVTTSTTCVISVFVKAETTANIVLLRCADTGLATYFGSYFNIETGAVLSSNTANGGVLNDAYVEPYANGWYRLTVVGTITTSSNADFYLYFTDTDGNASMSGAGQTMLAWGGQFENTAGGAAGCATGSTSYIPTTTASATRALDDTTSPFELVLGESWTVYGRMIESGAVSDGGALHYLINIGSDAQPRVLVYAPGFGGGISTLFADVSNTAISSTATNVTPAVGDILEFRSEMEENGSVRMHGSVNEATDISGSASAAAGNLSPPELASRVITLGSAAASNWASNAPFYALLVLRGTGYTMAECREFVT